jgi:hypothetical protein
MATVPRSIFRLRIRTVLLLFAVGMIVWSAFSYWTEYSESSARRARELLAPPLGANCTISLDGMEAAVVYGKIVDQSERWIVLQQEPAVDVSSGRGKKIWIPLERVLLIQFDQ